MSNPAPTSVKHTYIIYLDRLSLDSSHACSIISSESHHARIVCASALRFANPLLQLLRGKCVIASTNHSRNPRKGAIRGWFRPWHSVSNTGEWRHRGFLSSPRSRESERRANCTAESVAHTQPAITYGKWRNNIKHHALDAILNIDHLFTLTHLLNTWSKVSKSICDI